MNHVGHAGLFLLLMGSAACGGEQDVVNSPEPPVTRREEAPSAPTPALSSAPAPAATPPPEVKPAGPACSDGEECNQKGETAGHAEDFKTAVAFWEKGCELKSAKACANLGDVYRNGIVTTEDKPRGAASFAKACELGHANACTQAGLMYKLAEGVPADAPKALALWTKGCDGQDRDACFNAGMLSSKGTGVPVNMEAAVGFYEKACVRANALACTYAGIIVTMGQGGMAKQPDRGTKLFTSACDLREPQGCYNLGVAYTNGIGVAKDATRANEAFKRACLAGDMESCVAFKKR